MLEDLAGQKPLRIFDVTVTIDGQKEHRLWTMLYLAKALAQWSDPSDPSYKRIEKIEIVPSEVKAS